MSSRRSLYSERPSRRGILSSLDELTGGGGDDQPVVRARAMSESIRPTAPLPTANSATAGQHADAQSWSMDGAEDGAANHFTVVHHETDYERVFDQMAVFREGEPLATIDKEQFKRIATSTRHLDLSNEEAERVWAQVDVSGVGRINQLQFVNAVRRHRFLRRIVACYLPSSCNTAFHLDPRYDYSKSTMEVYGQPYIPPGQPGHDDQFVGKWVDFRKKLDYAYHSNYTPRRQLWQDEVITSVASKTEKQKDPWVVYTCGPMGAGKGFALSWMSQRGYFPLEHIVHVDPDRFKELMPEWSGYKERDAANAGTLCHRESGYLQEVTQEVAMRQKQHVWIDGSLRDGEWYSKVFDTVRARYPEYRIAIFFVNTSKEIAWTRCQARAKVTGRMVPEAVFLDSINSPDHVLRMLTPKVDFIARINNNETPKLEAFESIDYSGDWEAIRRHFAKQTPLCQGRFPDSFGPWMLRHLESGPFRHALTSVLNGTEYGECESPRASSEGGAGGEDSTFTVPHDAMLDLLRTVADTHRAHSSLERERASTHSSSGEWSTSGEAKAPAAEDAAAPSPNGDEAGTLRAAQEEPLDELHDLEQFLDYVQSSAFHPHDPHGLARPHALHPAAGSPTPATTSPATTPATTTAAATVPAAPPLSPSATASTSTSTSTSPAPPRMEAGHSAPLVFPPPPSAASPNSPPNGPRLEKSSSWPATPTSTSDAAPPRNPLEVHLSPEHLVTLSTFARRKAGCPNQALTVRYFHPLSTAPLLSQLASQEIEADAPGVALLLNGGLVWLGLDKSVVAVSECVSDRPWCASRVGMCVPKVDRRACQVANLAKTPANKSMYAEFQAPVDVPFVAAAALEKRWVRVSEHARLDTLHCRHFKFVASAWVGPGERIVTGERLTMCGGLAFLLHPEADFDPGARSLPAELPRVLLFPLVGSHGA